MRWRHELWYCKAGFNCLFCQRIIKSDDDQVFTQIKIRSVYPGRRTRITLEEIRNSNNGRTDHFTRDSNCIVILCKKISYDHSSIVCNIGIWIYRFY